MTKLRCYTPGFYRFSFPFGSKEYEAAYKAMDSYMKYRPNASLACKMRWAVGGASLHLDRHTGDIVLTEPNRYLAGLVKAEILKQISGQAQNTGMEIILGRGLTDSVKRSIAWLGLLQALADIKKRIKNERILSRSDSKSRNEVNQIKLKLVALMIAKSNGGNMYSKQLGYINFYEKYWKAYHEYWHYIQLDMKKNKVRQPSRTGTIRQG